METLKIFISYTKNDADFAEKLSKDLREAGIEHKRLDQISIKPGDDLDIGVEVALKNADVVFALISAETYLSKFVIDEIAQAKQYAKIIMPILTGNYVTMPLFLQNIQAIDMASDYRQGFGKLLEQVNILKRKNLPATAAPPPYLFPANRGVGNTLPVPAPKTGILKSILRSLNPFKKNRDTNFSGDIDYGSITTQMDKMIEAESGAAGKGGGYITSAKPPGRNKSKDDESPASSGAAFFPEMAPDDPPSPAAAAPQAPSPSQSSKGKILYDIPDNMMVNRQQKCIVRIGETETIVRDDDAFSGSEVVEDVPIARVMNVELIDISEPPHFNIKTINAAEQELEKDSYSQWLFWVTPLSEGNFSLLLKVSVIKIIDGKERRKELVFEKPVTIAAQPVATPQPLMDAQPKNLLDEKDITELDPPAVFISYAHKDKDYFDVFVENLTAQSGWNIWTDKNIEIGSGWYNSIQEAIKDTDMAVLLVSAFFISSGFIKDNEYSKFGDLLKTKPGFIFLPVLLRDVEINRWQSLSQMQFFSADGDDYGYPDFKGKLLPFAALCLFNDKGELNENYRRDTYFKNFVVKANTNWLKAKKYR